MSGSFRAIFLAEGTCLTFFGSENGRRVCDEGGLCSFEACEVKLRPLWPVVVFMTIAKEETTRNKLCVRELKQKTYLRTPSRP